MFASNLFCLFRLCKQFFSIFSIPPLQKNNGPFPRTLRWGDNGLRTTAGSHFQDWDETRVFSHPTVASSRRCVVERFYVVWKGGLRIHQKGMKKQFKVRKLRNSCCQTLELQPNARLEQFQVLMNSDQRKMQRLRCLLIFIANCFPGE